MKRTRNEVQGKASRPLTLQFDTQPLTAFSGLILFQHLFALVRLKEKLRGCFRHLPNTAAYPHHVVVLVLIVHLLLGFRHLRDVHYYANDDMVKRTVGPATPPRRRLHQPTIEHHRCDQRRAAPCGQPPPRARAPRPPSPRAHHARLRPDYVAEAQGLPDLRTFPGNLRNIIFAGQSAFRNAITPLSCFHGRSVAGSPASHTAIALAFISRSISA